MSSAAISLAKGFAKGRAKKWTVSPKSKGPKSKVWRFEVVRLHGTSKTAGTVHAPTRGVAQEIVHQLYPHWALTSLSEA